MDPHSLLFFSNNTWDFRSLLKDDLRVGRHDFNSGVIKAICKSHSFFNLLAKFKVVSVL